MVHPLNWLSPHAPFFTHTKGDADLGSSTAFMPLSFALSLPPAFPFHIHLSHMWWEQCLERRDGLLLGESFLILLAKTIHSLWCDYHYFPLFFCVFCSHLDQWPMLFPLLYRQCPITYFSVCQCLVWRPVSNRYGMECLSSHFCCHFHLLLSFSNGLWLMRIWYLRAWSLLLDMNLPFIHPFFIQTLQIVHFLSHSPMSCFL